MTDERRTFIRNRLQTAMLAAHSIQEHPGQEIENEQRAIQIIKNLTRISEALKAEELLMPADPNKHLGAVCEDGK